MSASEQEQAEPVHSERRMAIMDTQYYLLAKCRGYTERCYRENGRFPMACVVTFGCPFVRVNKMLTKHGKYRSTEWKEI